MDAPIIHLVDDDARYLAATARSLGIAGHRTAAFTSGEELLSQVSTATRGCVIADLDMPGISGLELQGILAERGIRMPVVFLTGQGDIPSCVTAMQSGAVNFLQKLAPLQELVAAIGAALEREADMHAVQARQDARRKKLALLSQRELEVLALVVRGKMNKQIADILGISERTVKLHRTTITGKLGIRRAAQLVDLVRDSGLELPVVTKPAVA